MNIPSLICALVIGGVLSLLFPSTRGMGIICVVILTYLFPLYTAIPVVLGIGIYCWKRW